MSGIAHPSSPVRFRVRSSRLVLLMVAVLVVTATVIGVIALSSGDSSSVTRTVAPTSQTGGPNEATRGQSAASASGSSQRTQPGGGPNEAARGNAAASASRP